MLIGLLPFRDNEFDCDQPRSRPRSRTHRLPDEVVVIAIGNPSFAHAAVMACDDEIIPSQERIENVADDANLEAVYETERHLLYVA
jgi:hypothetical protein